MRYCRACGAKLPNTDLLVYHDMPKSAQHFPSITDLSKDTGVDIVLNQCPYCGLVQATGEPVEYYRDVIRAVGISEEMETFRLKQFKDWVMKHDIENKRIIEIGCGHGEYLKPMETTGAEIYGLEHNPYAVSDGNAHGHQIYEGFIEDENTVIKGAPYDAFYCLNFLEHIPNPALFLRGIYNNLSDNAYGLIEVPNFDMILAKSLYSEFIQDHLSYFTTNSFINLLQNNGFEVLSTKEIWRGYIISADIKKRHKLNVSNFIKKQDALKQSIQQYLTKCKQKGIKIAAWGAGHQALANLSLLEMTDGIEFIIDSAPFKQNKMTPSTHIPIYGPEILKDGSIGAVIIMAAGFSEEIASYLTAYYPNIELSILGESFRVVSSHL